jgi:CheY-like chemotaxis protein
MFLASACRLEAGVAAGKDAGAPRHACAHRRRAGGPPAGPPAVAGARRPACTHRRRRVHGDEDVRVDPADPDNGHARHIVTVRRGFQLYDARMASIAPRVLVADDEEPIRRLLLRALRREGFDMYEARDGQEAIEQLDAGDFDALVLDLMMPRVDGFGVVSHIIETKPGMIEKTVVITAFPQTAVKERLHHLCCVLSKPFEMAELIAKVEECTRR